MQDSCTSLLYTPRNMFSVLKKRLRNMIISNKEQVAKEVSQIMHGFIKGAVEGFFRRTLENVQHFYYEYDYKAFL